VHSFQSSSVAHTASYPVSTLAGTQNWSSPSSPEIKNYGTLLPHTSSSRTAYFLNSLSARTTLGLFTSYKECYVQMSMIVFCFPLSGFFGVADRNSSLCTVYSERMRDIWIALWMFCFLLFLTWCVFSPLSLTLRPWVCVLGYFSLR
jgi:hypothetical protein